MRTRWLLLASSLLLLAFLAWLAGGGAALAPQAAPAGSGGAAIPAAADAGQQTTTPPTADGEAASQRTAVDDQAPGLCGRLLQDDRPLPGVELCASTSEPGRAAPAPTSTDADGRFFLPLPAGTYRLALRGAGVPSGFAIRRVRLATGQRFDLGDLAVPRPARVRGRVVDEDGRAIAGARVGLQPAMGSIGQPDHDDARGVEAQTGGDGRFAVAGLLPGEVPVHVQHAGHYAWPARIEVAAGGEADLGDVVMLRTAVLRGFVADAHGAPIAGARVAAGGYSMDPPVWRDAVPTGADGGFELRAPRGTPSLYAAAAGFETQRFEIAAGEPLRCVLQPALLLSGRVLGTNGCSGTLYLGAELADERCWRPWVRDLLRDGVPIAADGSFGLEGLPAGSWLLSGLVPGAGCLPPLRVELPLPAPLQLELQPLVEVAVELVDDLGAPVANARLARRPQVAWQGADPFDWSNLGWPYQTWIPVDASGRATVRLLPGEALVLQADSPDHLPGGQSLAADALPPQVRIVLPRGGVLCGRIDAAELLRHARLAVQIHQAAAPDQFAGGAECDSRGEFRSAPLPAGRYRVGVVLLDATHFCDGELPRAAPVPLLGNFDPVLPEVEVELRDGDVQRLELARPACGELRGRVLAGGRPLADAIVFGRDPNEKGLPFGFPDADDHPLDRVDAFESHPSCRTDADGRFRFLIGAAGTYELRARHPRGARWSEPLALTLTLPRDAVVERDIALRAASIRGSFDLEGVPVADRAFWEAHLYPLQDAARDPFYFTEWSLPQSSGVLQAPLARTGAFAFECLPAGGHVLRVVARSNRIVLTRVLHTVGDEVIELGPLQAEKVVAPRLGCGLSAAFGVWVRLMVAGGGEGVYVATVSRHGEAAMDWGSLVPGRYRLQAFTVAYEPGALLGVGGAAVGAPVEVEVHADGSCTPAVVWPDGAPK